jgi:hypothetical protein
MRAPDLPILTIAKVARELGDIKTRRMTPRYAFFAYSSVLVFRLTKTLFRLHRQTRSPPDRRTGLGDERAGLDSVEPRSERCEERAAPGRQERAAEPGMSWKAIGSDFSAPRTPRANDGALADNRARRDIACPRRLVDGAGPWYCCLP